MTSLIGALGEEALSCGVCLELMTHASIFPCGHSLCAKCAEECVNLKHQCPFCKAPAEREHIVRNLALQALVDAVSEASSKHELGHFSALQSRAVALGDVDAELRHHFNPIESIFAMALRTSFAQYQGLFRGLSRRLEIAIRTAGALPEPGRSARINAAEQEFSISMQLLQQDCERFLANTIVSPFLLSSTLTVSCPQRNAHFNMEVNALTTSSAVLDAIRGHFSAKATNTELKSFQEPIELCLVRQQPQETIHIDVNSPRPLGDYMEQGRIDSTWAIVLRSDVALTNDLPDACFAQLFGTPEQPVSVDYFACKDCGITWVCATCAQRCHAGHTLRTHILEHVPTWACCYCYKKHSKSHCKFVHHATAGGDGEAKTAS